MATSPSCRRPSRSRPRPPRAAPRSTANSSPASRTRTRAAGPATTRSASTRCAAADIDTELTATTRTGMARFTFPRNPHSSVLINAGGSAQPDDFAAVQIDPARREIDGTASSGLFCGQRPRYRVYIAAVFDRPFGAYGTWEGDKVTRRLERRQRQPGAAGQPEDQRRRGRLRDLRHPPQPRRHGPGRRLLRQRRGRSRQPRRRKPRARASARSAAARRGRLEPARWAGSGSAAARRAASTPSTRRSTTPSWRRAPSATSAAPTSAWTACCTAPHGRIQYADFSGWDTYRTQIQLLSMLAPQRASEMVALAARRRRRERLPAALALRQRPEHDHGRRLGRPADRLRSRLRRHRLRPPGRPRGDAEGRRRTVPQRQRRIPPAPGPRPVPRARLRPLRPRHQRPQRQLDLRQPRRRLGLGGDHARVRGRRLRDRPVRRPRRSAIAPPTAALCSVQATGASSSTRGSGQIEPRYENGAFPADYDNLRGGGFVEGDSVQYSWMVPHDPAGLFARDGRPGEGDGAARPLPAQAQRRRRRHPHRPRPARQRADPARALALRLDAAAPTSTQAAVRRALRLYSTAPDGYPGNDDLGTLSSWYVFGALGLYPEVPGSRPAGDRQPALRPAPRSRCPPSPGDDLGQLPTRSSATANRSAQVALSPARRPIHQRACGSTATPYGQPWTTYCALARGADLAFQLGRRPNRKLGQLRRRGPALLRPRPPDAETTPARLDPHADPLRRPLGAGRPDRARHRDPLCQPRRAELPPRRGDHRRPRHPRQLRRHAARR